MAIFLYMNFDCGSNSNSFPLERGQLMTHFTALNSAITNS